MSSRVRAVPAAVLACLLACLLAACTSGGGSPAPSSDGASPASAAPSSGPSGPVSAGPTVAAAAKSCPWAGQLFVRDTTGMRQGRITVLRSGGRVVGCRFYAQQEPGDGCDATCLRNENLPGPSQPSVEIVRSTYPSPRAAYNAFVRASQEGTGASTVTIRQGVPGVIYRHAFDPADGARDWACGWSVGTTRWLVRLAENSSSGQLEVSLLARQVARAA